MPQCHGFATPRSCLRSPAAGVLAAVLLVFSMPVTSAACDLIDDRLEPVRVLSVSPDGVKAEGVAGVLRLASFRAPADNVAAMRSALAVLAAPPPGAIVEAAVLGKSDRWGRKPAVFVLRRADGTAARFPDDLIAAGNGLVWPEPGDDPCFAAFQANEDAARSAKAGLWSGGLTLIAEDTQELMPAADGRPAEVSGVVEAVVFRRNRIYVNFGANYRKRVSVQVALPKDSANRDALRTRINDLAGRKVLIRGIVEAGGATPRLMVSDARQIRVLDGTRK